MKMMPMGEVQTQQPVLRPKPWIRMTIGVVAIVIILIFGIVFADYFVFKKIIFKGEEKKGEERAIVGMVTMQQLVNDFDNTTMSFKTYKPGTAVYIHDTVTDVQSIETSYGTFTAIGFNATYQSSSATGGSSITMPLVIKGNKTTEYTIGSYVTIYTPIDEYTIGGRKMVLWGEELPCPVFFLACALPYFIYSLNEFFGPRPIILNGTFTASGNEKLVVVTSEQYNSGNLNEYSVVLGKGTFTNSLNINNLIVVDGISSLTPSATSPKGHIQFTDANSSSKLDSGDYFIVSVGTTNSKYIWDIYELTLKRGNSNETSNYLMLGYKGFFYVESYY